MIGLALLLASLLGAAPAAKGTPAPAPAAPVPTAAPKPSLPAPAPAKAAAKDAPPAEPPPPPSTPEMYEAALAAHAKGDTKTAVARLHAWLHGAPRTADNYQPAQHLLAQDLHHLGLVHAALVYEEDVVRSRTRPELLPEALARLQQWSAVPHDEVRLEEELLHGTDFGALDQPARDWVAYVQGSFDLRAGNDRWAKGRFAELADHSAFRARARLLEDAIKLERSGEDAEGRLADFEAIGKDEKAPRDVRNDARISAARLHFEQGDYNGALALYESVDLPELDPGRGQIYLEEAWARYRSGEGSRAMGLLAALEAPSFRALFLPEKFLLRALIFKDACQWLSAKRAAKTVLRRYSPSLDAVHDRRDLTRDPILADAALQKGRGKRAADLVAQLGREHDLLERYTGAFAEGGLATTLSKLYAQEMSEAERQRQLELEAGVARSADELLGAVEQAGLVDYEVGLALYRRGRPDAAAPALTFSDDKPGPNQEAYEFDGEYWNDELPALRFSLVNRCREVSAP
jgi:hypothetical protein